MFHGPFGVHGRLKPENIHRLQDAFGRMQQIARTRGMTVLWENVHWCALREMEDVRTLVRLLPEIGFVLDVKQAYRAGVSPFDMLDAMGDRVRHVHVLDTARDGSLCLPGQGTFDWLRLIRQLQRQGYDGAVILEPYEAQAKDEAALRGSLDFLRRSLQG